MSHSPVFPTGLTVDTADWTRTDGRIWARITRGFHDNLEARGQDVTVPGLAGQRPMARRAHQRLVEATGMVLGTGATEQAAREDFLTLRAAMFAQMRPDAGPYQVDHTDESGTVWSITARPLRIEWGGPELPSYREFVAYWLAVGEDADPDVGPEWVEVTGS